MVQLESEVGIWDLACYRKAGPSPQQPLAVKLKLKLTAHAHAHDEADSSLG